MRKQVGSVPLKNGARLEAFRFEGLSQPFPEHFHDYYVLGRIRAGNRVLTCNGEECRLGKDSFLVFSPGDRHACIQCGKQRLDYDSLHIPAILMEQLAEESTGNRIQPLFRPYVLEDEELNACFSRLHTLVLHEQAGFELEESLLLLLSRLFALCQIQPPASRPVGRAEIIQACQFMDTHYDQHLNLDEIAAFVGLSKSTLLRAFARTRGITPWRYLENIRIIHARRLLEKGIPPAEVALQTGFYDQSHFTSCFSRFTGLGPGLYQSLFLKEPADE